MKNKIVLTYLVGYCVLTAVLFILVVSTSISGDKTSRQLVGCIEDGYVFTLDNEPLAFKDKIDIMEHIVSYNVSIDTDNYAVSCTKKSGADLVAVVWCVLTLISIVLVTSVPGSSVRVARE